MAAAPTLLAPRTPAQRALRLLSPDPASRPAPNAGVRQIKSRARTFIALMASHVALSPVEAARQAGYRKPTVGDRLAEKYADLIESYRVRLGGATQMELDECLRGMASLARSADDERVRLGALQTIARVHGALADKQMPPAERRSMATLIEELVASVSAKAGAIGAGNVRALVESTSARTGKRTRVGVSVEQSAGAGPDASVGLLPEADADELT